MKSAKGATPNKYDKCRSLSLRLPTSSTFRPHTLKCFYITALTNCPVGYRTLTINPLSPITLQYRQYFFFCMEEELINIRAHRAGIFYRVVGAGQNVHQGDTLARILAPYDCSVLEEVKAPESGVVFFAHNRPLALEHNVIYRIQRL